MSCPSWRTSVLTRSARISRTSSESLSTWRATSRSPTEGHVIAYAHEVGQRQSAYGQNQVQALLFKLQDSFNDNILSTLFFSTAAENAAEEAKISKDEKNIARSLDVYAQGLFAQKAVPAIRKQLLGHASSDLLQLIPDRIKATGKHALALPEAPGLLALCTCLRELLHHTQEACDDLYSQLDTEVHSTTWDKVDAQKLYAWEETLQQSMAFLEEQEQTASMALL